MSKTLQNKNKNNYTNYLTLNNGCKIIYSGPKPLAHHNAQNILTDNIKQVWLSQYLPATCIIDMRNIIQKPTYFNRIGFNSWHQYQSNPKLIQIQYTGQDNPQNAVWVVLSKIRLQLLSGWQHFKLPTILSKSISYIRIKIIKNHTQVQLLQNDNEQQNNEQTKTYLNQVSLGYVQQIIQSRVQITGVNTLNSMNTINNNTRQKTFSEYRKLSSSQRQIKKLVQKIKYISSDNQTMKRTIDHQNSIIIKLQQAVHKLAQTVNKLQKIQNIQQHQLYQLSNNNNLSKLKLNNNNKHNKKHKINQYFHNQQQQIAYTNQQINKNNSKQKQTINKIYSKQKQTSKHNSIYQQHQSQISKHNSIYKSNKGKSNNNNNNQKSNKSNNKQRSNHSKNRQIINVGEIDQSDNSMSEYQGVVDQRVYNYGGRYATNQKQRRTNNKQINNNRQSNNREYNNRQLNSRQLNNRQLNSKQVQYIPMLQKLQQLIMLRDQKKNRLKTSKKPLNKNRRSQNIILSSQQQQQQQNNTDNYDSEDDN